MPRFVILKLDMDELPKLITGSAKVALASHGISLPEANMVEVGKNAAASVVMTYDVEAYEERLEIWAHIVSEHCNMAPPGSLAEMLDYHHHEHKGPGTIRNHPESSRKFSLRKLAAVLSELEPEDDYDGSFSAAADNEGARICATDGHGDGDFDE